MHHFYIPKVITGGATSTPAFVQHISKHCDMYVNAYGPSEIQLSHLVGYTKKVTPYHRLFRLGNR